MKTKRQLIPGALDWKFYKVKWCNGLSIIIAFLVRLEISRQKL